MVFIFLTTAMSKLTLTDLQKKLIILRVKVFL